MVQPQYLEQDIQLLLVVVDLAVVLQAAPEQAEQETEVRAVVRLHLGFLA
jgi:hypothetical protein